MVLLLLNAGADVTATDATGATPLHKALHSDTAIQTLLLWGADVDARNMSGETPGTFSWKPEWEGAAGFAAAVASVPHLFWTRALHPRLPQQSRKVVFTTLLCMRHGATTATDVQANEGGAADKGALEYLPMLPVELREGILGFVRAVDLAPFRASA